MAPNNKLNINIQPPRLLCSTIIKFQHLNIFASWIDRKETLHYNEIEHIPYRFELLYHFNKNDGTTIATFHEKCDNKGPTIVIAKVTNSEQIIGGYNPLQWDSSNSYKSTNDSFIFSFTDRTNLQSAKVGYIINNNNQHSIYCGLNYGPTFGGGHDLYCQNNATWSYSPQSYSKIDIPYSFNVDNYEVFQVIKK